MKKIICFLLLVFMLIPFAVSCNKDEPEESPKYIDTYEFELLIGDKSFVAKQINSKPEGDNITIYTREYMRDGKYSVIVGEAQEGRTALSVRYILENGNPVFDIVDKVDDVASAQIPYNGFVITLKSSELDGVRANKGTVVKVEGYDKAVSGYERNDLAMFNPGYLSGTASRRISMKNPVNDFAENKIYYIDDEFGSDKEISVDNLTVVLKRKTANNYGVVSASKESKISKPSKGELKLVFTGAYNIAYAQHYLKTDERVSFDMVSKMNEYTDVPAVLINKKMVSFGDNYRNCEIKEDGLYLYDSDYSAAVTPKTDKKRVDMIFVEDTVVKVEVENTRSLIPDGNGFVISFVGEDAIKNISDYKMGSTVETYFIESSKLSNMYAKIGTQYFCITAKNTVRLEAYTVLYNSQQSANTGTNPYGTEIIVVDNVVSSVQRGIGNAEIPANGYVISVHEGSDYYPIANKIKKGAQVELCLTGPDYNITSLKYTGMNTTRTDGALIIYNGKDGKKSSGTNEFGYEIAVDKDGFVIEGSSAGNLKIPQGGFVLSGHGANKNAIADAFAIGETVLVDSKTKSVKIIETPDSKITHSKFKFDEVNDKLELAKKKLENLDYKTIGENMEILSGLVAQAEKSFKEFDYESALSSASAVISSCDEMVYQLIESKTVQNRAVWYRSTEKNDDEVRAVVEKLKKLNVNAIYIETWYEGYCIGKKVEVPGITTHANNGDYDALEGFVRIAHENGIEVHSWVHNFFVGHFGNSYKSYNPTFAPEKYEDKYLIDRNGKKHFFYSENNNYFVFLNPNDRECRDMLIDIYKQLVSKYEIDGLHLDYVRFPELNYGKDDFGYNQDIIDGFVKKTGITTDPRLFKDGSVEKKYWIEYRCGIVTSFIKEVTSAVRGINNDLWISAATYPDITLSKNTIFQDVVGLADSGCIDEFFSMSYGIEVDTVMISVKNYLKTTKDKTFYSSGIAAFLETTQLSFAQQLAAVTKAGVDGLSVFSLNSINPETYQNQMTNGAYREKAVQVYKLSLTASAQMDYICDKIDNIDDICKELNADDLELVKSKCAEIKQFSDDFDLENASASAKIKWCNDTISKIETVKADIVSECGENNETDMLIKDFDDLEYWLTLSVKRLEARK